MNDLIAWLRARLDEVERVALDALEGRPGRWVIADRSGESALIEIAAPDEWAVVVYDEGSPTPAQARHIVAHDPVAVVADVNVKRRVLDEVAKKSPGERGYGVATQVTRLLSLQFDRHPGYRSEWRP